MKCPTCGHNQKVKDGLVCGGCRYRFTFNPKESTSRGMTDGKFAACLRAASQNNTTWFTENQLYAVFCRRVARVSTGSIVSGVALIVVGVGLAFSEAWPFAIMALIFLIRVLAGILWGRRKIPRQRFELLLDRWQSSGKVIEKLITSPALHKPPPEWNEPDIYDYGVERILIVERDILVDLFVKNGLHAEQKMLILAESGYPDYLQPITQRLLTEQADLPVFLLHDATTHGAAMEARVLASNALPLDGHPMTDLGMFPTDFQKLKRTKRFDPDNAHRALPADAMLLPFMTMGLGAAMAEGIAFSGMLERQQRGVTHGVGYDFG